MRFRRKAVKCCREGVHCSSTDLSSIPTSGGSCWPVTPDPGNPTLWLAWAPAYVHIPPHKYTKMIFISLRKQSTMDIYFPVSRSYHGNKLRLVAQSILPLHFIRSMLKKNAAKQALLQTHRGFSWLYIKV